MIWTDDQIAALCKLWADSRTMDMIARQLGTSRNGVSGKINRLRIDQHPGIVAADAKRGPRLSNTDRVAEWMAEHGGTLMDCSRSLWINEASARTAWRRVIKAMGAQAV